MPDPIPPLQLMPREPSRRNFLGGCGRWVTATALGILPAGMGRTVAAAPIPKTAGETTATHAASVAGPTSRAQQHQPIRIGLISQIDHTDAMHHWQPVFQVLKRLLGGRQLDVQLLDEEALAGAVADGQLDFVITNQRQFVQLRRSYDLSALATVRTRVGNYDLDQMGAVIFTRGDAHNLDSLRDVRKHRLAATERYSLTSFLLAQDAFADAGVDLNNPDDASVSFVGYPHDRVVKAVLANEADVGIVRTGVLEDLLARHELAPDQIKILNARSNGGYPQLLSTEVGPGWPWSALYTTDPELAREVTLALLRMSPDEPELRGTRYAGFAPPASYANVEAMIRRLNAYPTLGLADQLNELWTRYQGPASAVLALVSLGGLSFSGLLWRSNRRLRELSALYMKARASLQTTAAAFDSQVGLLVTDSAQRVLRVNAALTQILGYEEAELKGQRTDLLRSPSVTEREVLTAWNSLLATGSWRGEVLCRHAKGHDVPCLITISAIREQAAGMEGFVGSFVDISQQRRDQAAIEQLAFFDGLTGLPNRRRFLERLNSEVEVAHVSGRHGALMFIDLDHFKTLNDAHGHALGDELLKRIAQRLSAAVGSHGLVARLGGDEFVVMLGRLSQVLEEALNEATEVADRVRAAILQPFQLPLYGEPERDGMLSHRCSASIGLALFGKEELEVHEVMKRADIAMYLAKQAGRNTIRHFDPRAQARLHARAALAADLADALLNNQFQLHYQVQTDGQGIPRAAECLLRWHHPTQGPLLPADFIPVAEETGAIVAMGDWVIREALATLAAWRDDPALSRLSLCVNVSPRQFSEPDFVTKLQQAVLDARVPAGRLTLELTESIVLERLDEVEASLHRLRQMGVSLALDDFGTGYSSMSYLQRLPLHQVKIDSSFIVDLPRSVNSAAIVRTIIALARSLDLLVVAEGVETDEQRKLLVNLGADLLQGYHMGSPQTRGNFELEQRRHPQREPLPPIAL